MAIIHADPNVAIQINVFEVDPANQDALAELLVETVQRASNMPGWRSASIHKGFDGRRATNDAQTADYASWEEIAAKLRRKDFSTRFKQWPSPILVCTTVFSA